MRRKKDIINHKGDIYYVDPKHLVKSSDNNEYAKRRDPNRKRPVIIGEQKKKDIVQVSQLTTQVPTEKQKRRYYIVEMIDTPAKSGKSNYVDTRTIAKSKSTNEVFKIGKEPLIKVKGRISDKDYKSYSDARKRRYPNKK